MTLLEIIQKQIKAAELQVINVSVDDVNQNLIDGTPENGAEVFDATTSPSHTNIKLTPTIGAKATILLTNPPIVLQYDQLDQLQAAFGNLEIQINEQGLKVQKGSNSLNSLLSDTNSLLSDIVSLLETFKVICSPAGTPSTVLEPTTLAKVQTLKPKIQTLQNNINNLLA